MTHECLAYLCADVHHRIQRGLGFLEDHAYRSTAHITHTVLRQFKQVLAIQADRAAGDARRGWQQTHDRQRRHRFAAARLPYQDNSFAGCNRETEAVNCSHRRAWGAKLYGQLVDFQQTRFHQDEISTAAVALGRRRKPDPMGLVLAAQTIITAPPAGVGRRHRAPRRQKCSLPAPVQTSKQKRRITTTTLPVRAPIPNARR